MGNHEQFPPLTQDVLYGLDAGLFDDEVGHALLQIWSAGVCDNEIAAMIRHRAASDRLHQALGGMPFRPPKLREGELVLGLDLEDRPIRIPIQYLNAHSLTVANTGSGKTTKSRFWALQIAPCVQGMWLIDLRKQEFRLLRQYLSRLGIDLIVVPVRMMRLNPLQVPLGVAAPEWTPRAAEMLIQVLGLPPRASKLVQTTLFRLYRRWSASNLYPTLFDLFEEIRGDRAANPQARQALLDSLEPVLCSLGPQILGYRRAWPPHELAKHPLVIEFGGIGEVEKSLILNYLILSEFVSRVARGISNPQMDLWICCDEAQRLCAVSSGAGQTSGVEDIIGIVRGTGIGLDLSVLSLSGVAPQIVSNCALKVMGRCGSAADYLAAGQSMGLNADQIRWAGLHLVPGMFIGQVGEGPFRHPFVFRVPGMRVVSEGHVDPNPGPMWRLMQIETTRG